MSAGRWSSLSPPSGTLWATPVYKTETPAVARTSSSSPPFRLCERRYIITLLCTITNLCLYIQSVPTYNMYIVNTYRIIVLNQMENTIMYNILLSLPLVHATPHTIKYFIYWTHTLKYIYIKLNNVFKRDKN